MKFVPSKDQIQRLIEIKRLYDQFKTLEEVARRLNLTRERVRQLLKKGQEYKLYKYELTWKKDLNNLINKVSREEFTSAIKSNPKKYAVCSRLSIDLPTYYKLSKYYQIGISDYADDARQKKYLLLYSNIVETLGHHPSTTELFRNHKWRYTWVAIDRIWGGIEKFRREFGIDRPKYNIHPNTKLAFQRAKEKAKQKKLNKIYQVENIIKSKGPISTKKINKELGYTLSTLAIYISHLIENNKIRKIGTHWTAKYI